MRTLLILLFLVACYRPALAQDSCGLRITLLTCSPGEELYSTFGHTAIRVQQSATGVDEVYNYGTFEFAPDFYIKFIRGRLNYALSVEPYAEFLQTYQAESRSVVEQNILLSCAQKQALWQALQQNALEQNRYYRYDFLFDNCTTRAGNMIVQQAFRPVQYPLVIPKKGITFRRLLHTYLDRGGQWWSKLGIDILLGARLDRKVTNIEAQFLPDYLMNAMSGTTAAGKPLATNPQALLQIPSPLNKSSLFRPGIIFFALLLVVAALSFLKNAFARKVLHIFDFTFFLVLGFAGLLLLFMWFGTDHKVCRDNLNLLWALPTHLAAAVFVARGYGAGKTYFQTIFWGTLLLLAAWAFLPQALNPALIPIILLVILRSGALSEITLHARKNS